MLEGVFQRVKLERNTASQKFATAGGEQITEKGGSVFHSKQIRRFTDA